MTNAKMGKMTRQSFCLKKIRGARLRRKHGAALEHGEGTKKIKTNPVTAFLTYQTVVITRVITISLYNPEYQRHFTILDNDGGCWRLEIVKLHEERLSEHPTTMAWIYEGVIYPDTDVLSKMC